jgi:hypothetical protein
MPALRRATKPQRRFAPEALATLARANRRKLVWVLLTESGSRVVEVHRPVAYDETIADTLSVQIHETITYSSAA